MIDILVKDLDIEMTEVQIEEKFAQEKYVDLMADSGNNHAADSKSIIEKEAALRNLEEDLTGQIEEKVGTATEFMVILEYIQEPSCRM